jgi:hypothetical protein
LEKMIDGYFGIGKRGALDLLDGHLVLLRLFWSP